MADQFIPLPAADPDAPRRKLREEHPALMPIPQAKALPRPEVPLNPVPARIPYFKRIIGMPPVVPKAHLAARAYIG